MTNSWKRYHFYRDKEVTLKKVAILQSNYIPWKGYFDIIAAVDEFIVFDDVQYTRRDWRNRNKIKTPQGLQYLTVPVQVKGKYHQKIKDTKIEGTNWTRVHWKALGLDYRRAPYFDEIATWLKPLYLNESYQYISQLNLRFIKAVCDYLEIDTIISSSSDYGLVDGRTECLVHLCVQAGGTEYISGPSAKNYIQKSHFIKHNIKITWFDYTRYPEYPQLWGKFAHDVTILDLLFNCGKESPNFMKHICP